VKDSDDFLHGNGVVGMPTPRVFFGHSAGAQGGVSGQRANVFCRDAQSASDRLDTFRSRL
jgi:hypothetical protein